jgi:hypothetical protein
LGTGIIQSQAQMKIGDNPTVVDTNAILELESVNKGFLMTRVQLVNDTLSNPLGAHIAGMMVYNIDTSGSGNHQVVPGVYFNNGKKWIKSFDNRIPELIIDRQLLTITTNGQTTLNLPSIFTNVDKDSNFFLYRNGVLLIKDVDYSISTLNQVQIINPSFSLDTNDELYAILKTIKL